MAAETVAGAAHVAEVPFSSVAAARLQAATAAAVV